MAQYVIRDLLAKGDMVAAGCRHPEKLEHQEGLVPVQMDLHADVRDLAALIRGCDAVYFLADPEERICCRQMPLVQSS